MPTHVEMKQATRKRFLQAGLEVFIEQGLEATTVRDIVRVSGLAQGSFYNHFRNPEEVFDAVVEPLVAEAHQAVGEALLNAATAKSFLEQGLGAFLEVLGRHSWALPLIERNPYHFRAHLEGSASFRSLATNLQGLLEAGQRAGMFRAFDAEWMAGALVSTSLEVVIMAARKGHFKQDEMAKFLVDLFLPTLVS